MSRAWGRVASAVGQGVLQMGMQNQREKLEAQREANMARLRQENITREDKIIADKNTRQDELIKSDRDHNAGLLAEDREYRKGVLDEKDIHAESVRESTTKNTNEQKALDRQHRKDMVKSRGGAGSGQVSAQVQLINRLISLKIPEKEAIQVATGARMKSSGDRYAYFLNSLIRSNQGMEEITTLKKQAKEMVQMAKNFDTGNFGIAEPATGIDDSNKGANETTDQWLDRISGK